MGGRRYTQGGIVGGISGVVYISHSTREAYRVYYTSPQYPGGMLGVLYLSLWYPGSMLGVLYPYYGTREACWAMYPPYYGTREACWAMYYRH